MNYINGIILKKMSVSRNTSILKIMYKESKDIDSINVLTHQMELCSKVEVKNNQTFAAITKLCMKNWLPT